MKKSSVVILRSNPVDPDSRVEKEANSLIKAGYIVKILAWDRSSKYKLKESILKLSNGQVKIFRFGIPAEFGGGKKNLKSFIIFQYRLLKWLLKNRNQYQIIHACDFDTAYTAYYCAKILNKKLIYDIFDYLFTSVDGKYSMFKKYIVHLQHKIINYADGTIICSEKRKEQIEGSRPKNLVVIHNSPPLINEHLPKVDLDKSKVKIVYVGILQDNRFLLELADTIKDMAECELHIGGFGKYELYFEQISNNFNNIFYYGKLPYDKTLKLENSCDIMLAIYSPFIEDHYYAAPNKFYESLMLGKPVIMVKNTGMSEVISKHKIGEIIEFNKESLITGINNLIDKKEEWPHISLKMKNLYEQYYSWDRMEKKLINFYESL